MGRAIASTKRRAVRFWGEILAGPRVHGRSDDASAETSVYGPERAPRNALFGVMADQYRQGPFFRRQGLSFRAQCLMGYDPVS